MYPLHLAPGWVGLIATERARACCTEASLEARISEIETRYCVNWIGMGTDGECSDPCVFTMSIVGVCVPRVVFLMKSEAIDRAWMRVCS
jgi:hypothetical protein